MHIKLKFKALHELATVLTFLTFSNLNYMITCMHVYIVNYIAIIGPSILTPSQFTYVVSYSRDIMVYICKPSLSALT